MTAQVSDVVQWHGGEWLLAGIKGTGLFSPRAVGFSLRPGSTSCYRGYTCDYVVAEDLLYLERLTVYPASSEAPPQLWGVSPSHHKTLLAYVYDGLRRFTEVTGSLLVVADVASAWMRGVTPTPAAYAAVTELVLSEGRVVEARDHAAHLPELRAQLKALADTFEDGWSREQFRRFTALAWSMAPGFTPLPPITESDEGS